MDTDTYQRLLLKHALHTMACDGEVHPEEIAQVRRLIADTPYFVDIDAAAEAEAVLSQLREGGMAEVDQAVGILDGADLDSSQRLRFMEVLLSVMDADDVVTGLEQHYLRRVRSALGVQTHDLVTHFPTRLSWLMGSPAGSFSHEDNGPDVAVPTGLDGLTI